MDERMKDRSRYEERVGKFYCRSGIDLSRVLGVRQIETQVDTVKESGLRMVR